MPTKWTPEELRAGREWREQKRREWERTSPAGRRERRRRIISKWFAALIILAWIVGAAWLSGR